MSAWDSALARLNTIVRDTFPTPAVWGHGSLSTDISVVTSQSRNQEESLPPNYFTCWIVITDAPTIARGDTLEISSSHYRVLDVDPDGGGGVYVTAEKYTP